MADYTLRVVGKKMETADACTISFKQPALKKIKYKAGQYLTLRLTINHRKYRRPYSFSSAPGLDQTLDVTVKRVPGGVVSNYLVDVVSEGDLIEVMQPLGKFVVPEAHAGDIFLWGAGSGITPLMSILKDRLQGATGQKITLAYVNQSRGQIIFFDQLQQMAEQHPGRLYLQYFCTRELVEAGPIICERMNERHIIELLTRSPEPVSSHHFICGPEGLKENVRNVLTGQGVPASYIHTEDFEHMVDEQALSDIHTRKIQVITNVQSLSLDVVRGKSILEACLDLNMDLPYSCQNGTCTLCKGKLLNGQVKWIGPERTDHELQSNEFLLCCSHPLTDDVTIELNYSEIINE